MLKEGRIAQERREALELEREKLNVQIRMKEMGMVDSGAVAEQLRNFEKLMSTLSEEDRKDLVRLMVREIRVNSFDPEKEKLPSGEGVIPIKIRTQWFVVNITFFANDLFSNILKKDSAKFASFREWLPGLGLNQRPSD